MCQLLRQRCGFRLNLKLSPPLSAPTSRPEEPITAGADFGEGPGSEALMGMPSPQINITNILSRLAQYDDSGDTELIYRRLLDSGY